MRSSTLLIVSAAALAACVEAEDSCPDDTCGVSLHEIIRVAECTPWHCGGNSGLGNEIPFHDLHARGLPNDAGLSILRFEGPPTKEGVRPLLRLSVVGDDLYGWTSAFKRLEGAGLIGSRLILRRADSNFQYVLELRGAGTTGYWTGASPTDRVPTYQFVFRRSDESDKKFRPLCPARTENEWSGLQGQAVVFEGDRYHAPSKTVSLQTWREPDATWFNLACAGTAVSKMHLLRHTTAGSNASHVTSVAARTAMLKMLTGDYCGTGRTFTINDQPLRYMTSTGWYVEPLLEGPPDVFGLPIDGIWNERGAVCIGEPRLTFRSGYERIFLDIAADCGYRPIPWCPNFLLDWETHGHVISVSPGPTTLLP